MDCHTTQMIVHRILNQQLGSCPTTVDFFWIGSAADNQNRNMVIAAAAEL